MLTSRRTRPNVRGFAKVARDNRFLEGNRSSGPEGDYADKKGLGTHSMSRGQRRHVAIKPTVSAATRFMG
jgi:hypothetical protein